MTKKYLINFRTVGVMLFVCALLCIVCYYEGSWKTYLSWNTASDITNVQRLSEDGIFMMKYHGNVFRLWQNATYTFKLLLPILLMIPYIYSYIEEKSNGYRYYMITRKNYTKYMRDKFISVLGQSIVPIIIGQLIAMGIIFAYSAHDTSTELLENIVNSQYASFFLQMPYYFVFVQIIFQILYMIAFLIFSLGIASFLKQTLYIYILPFLIHTLISVILPDGYRLTNIFDLTATTFSILGYSIMMIVLIITGMIMIVYNERKWRIRG